MAFERTTTAVIASKDVALAVGNIGQRNHELLLVPLECRPAFLFVDAHRSHIFLFTALYAGKRKKAIP
jgi:hypothetical protein